MKNRLKTAIVAACALLGAPCAAQADVFTPGFYAVINYAGAFPNFKSVVGLSTPSYLDGVEADAGWRFNRYYSVEASYDYVTGTKEFQNSTYDTTLQSGSLDALGYLPLGPGSAWALYGDVGGSVYFFQGVNAQFISGNETRFGGRAGAGVQYQFSDDIGVRVGGRYEWAGLPTLKSTEVIAVGLVWQR